ncbi:MAG: HAD family hydrolase [Bacilli bacterium]
MKKPIVALIYDFDKTLSTTDMQNYTFIPSLGLTPAQFWGATTEFADREGIEKILSYMYMMLSETKKHNIHLTKKFLIDCGKDIKYYPGVESWFDRIDKYGKEHGVNVEHYVNSSGNKEIILGSSICKYFKAVYGCEFLYSSQTKEAIWPKTVINYTQKTQYLFRISKGALDLKDDNKVNKKALKKRVEMKNMVYIGDGLTDIPCMVLVRDNGGISIAITDDETTFTSSTLLKDKRVNFSCKPNYKEGSKLETIIKNFIDRASVQAKLDETDRQLTDR